VDAFARRLVAWYERHGRHDLPWQHPRTPYRVWISEVMLQQTPVASVTGYFQRFVAALPDVGALAAAPEDRVLALWSGLGYYHRARHLHAAAKVCAARYDAQLPVAYDDLVALPGIGRSTAGAILALAHGQRHAILDGNAKRVLSRWHGVSGWPGASVVRDRLWAYAQAHTPATRTADYTQAIMDLGATVCHRRVPECGACPQANHCTAHRAGTTAEIPGRRPRRMLPERQTVFIVLRDREGRVLLQRRPPQGVWPGLWSLPEAADVNAARVLAACLAGVDGRTAKALPEVRHGFTHFKLRATPLEWCSVGPHPAVADAPDVRWCGREQIAALGIPAPVRKLLSDRC
jgi:A/G-specific adenine glycosylase